MATEKCLKIFDLLNLRQSIPWEGVRLMIARKLTKTDLLMIRIAKNPKKEKSLYRRRKLCEDIAVDGHLNLLKWVRSKGCPGINGHVRGLPVVVIWKSSSGHMKMVAPGTDGLARGRQVKVIWMY